MKDILFVFDAEDASRAAVVLRRAEALFKLRSIEISEAANAASTVAEQEIEAAMCGSATTVWLLGPRRRVRAAHAFAMARGIAEGKPAIVIDISKIKTLSPDSTAHPIAVPRGAAFYFWLMDDGYANLGGWVSNAGIRAVSAQASRPLPHESARSQALYSAL